MPYSFLPFTFEFRLLPPVKHLQPSPPTKRPSTALIPDPMEHLSPLLSILDETNATLLELSLLPNGSFVLETAKGGPVDDRTITLPKQLYSESIAIVKLTYFLMCII